MIDVDRKYDAIASHATAEGIGTLELDYVACQGIILHRVERRHDAAKVGGRDAPKAFFFGAAGDVKREVHGAVAGKVGACPCVILASPPQSPPSRPRVERPRAKWRRARAGFSCPRRGYN